jgi:hypothetical protein
MDDLIVNNLSTEPEENILSLTYFLLAFHFSALEVMVWIANYN